MIQSRREFEVWVACHEQSADPLLEERRESSVQLGVVAGFRNEKGLADGPCRLLEILQLTSGRRVVRIQEGADQPDAWHEFMQQADPLRLYRSA